MDIQENQPKIFQPKPIRGPQPLGRNTNQPQGNVEHAPTGTKPAAKGKEKCYYAYPLNITTYRSFDKDGNVVTKETIINCSSSSSDDED